MRTAIDHFHSLMQQNPADALRQHDETERKFVERNVCFDGKAMAFHLRPHFISETVHRNLNAAAHTVMEAALKAADGMFGGDQEQLYEALNASHAERELWRIDPGIRENVVWSRLDAFLDEQGDDIRFLEFNNDAPAGIGYCAVMSRIYLEMPLMREFQKRFTVTCDDAREHLLASLLAAYREFGRTDHPQIAIVDWETVRTSSDFEILRAFFEEQGYKTIITDPRAVEMRDGKLHRGDFRIDLVYRRVVTSELLEKLDETKPFVEAYRAHAACFINPFRCRISENKAFLSFLTDPRHLGHLTDDERAALDRHIPWTRAVASGKTDFHGAEIDLAEFVADNRERFVLKPADGYGGKNVFVGSETEEGDWASAVNTALSEIGWVVQERVRTPVEPYPVRVGDGFEFREMKYNLNPFFIGGQVCGAVTRTSNDVVINVSAGGGSIPVFTVTDHEA